MRRVNIQQGLLGESVDKILRRERCIKKLDDPRQTQSSLNRVARHAPRPERKGVPSAAKCTKGRCIPAVQKPLCSLVRHTPQHRHSKEKSRGESKKALRQTGRSSPRFCCVIQFLPPRMSASGGASSAKVERGRSQTIR
jgi:hypothetical protein